MSSWPTDDGINSDNLGTGAASPALARVQLLAIANAVLAMIDSGNQPLGVPLLDAGGRVLISQIPNISIAAGGTGATNAAQARVNLGITSSGTNVRYSIPFDFSSALATGGGATDPQASWYWINETGYAFVVQNVVITRTRVVSGSDSDLSMAVLASPLATDGSAGSIIIAGSDYDTLLAAGNYQGSWQRTSTFPPGGTLQVDPSRALALYPRVVGGTPPEGVSGHFEGYLQTA